MDDLDLLVINTFIALTKGEIKSPLKELKYSKFYIEEKIRPSNGRAFPADLVMFSRKYNHAFLVEIKNITTSDFNQEQAENYNLLTPQSFSNTLTDHNELDRLKIDVAYHGHDANEQRLATELRDCGIDFPVLVYDAENLKIRRSADSGQFKYSRLKSAINDELKLEVESIEVITPYIKFSPYTNNYLVAQYAINGLLELTKPNTGTIANVDLSVLTKTIYSLIDVWTNLSGEYRRHLTRKVGDALRQMRDNGLNDFINFEGNNVGVDVFDSQGDVSPQKLEALKQRIQAAELAVSTTQTTLV